MYSYYFQFADLLIQINTQFLLTTFYEMDCYRVSNEEQKPVDAIYTLDVLPKDWKIRGVLLHESRKSKIYQINDEIHRYFFWNVHTEEKYIVLSYSKKDDSNFSIYIQEESIEEVLREFHFSGFMAMELILLKHQAFQLHSSVINWEGKGILFSAPSGTGKSTQADLWQKYESAMILNGDKALIRKIDEQYWVFGSPFAGTSGIYTNGCVPIQGIIVLTQAPENRIERLTHGRAFVKLYSESSVNTWNREFVLRFVDLLTDMVKSIPVYHLACLPDQGAVNLVKKTLFMEEYA